MSIYYSRIWKAIEYSNLNILVLKYLWLHVQYTLILSNIHWNHRTYLLNIKICMHHWNIQSLFISWKWRTVHVGWIFKSHTMYNINWIFKTVHTRVCHHASSYTFIYVPCLFSQASSSFLVCGIILKEVKATAWSECKVY